MAYFNVLSIKLGTIKNGFINIDITMLQAITTFFDSFPCKMY